ncbi:uncharacterized protein RHO17_022818 isoform 1-T1 [Thomomys bottae]
MVQLRAREVRQLLHNKFVVIMGDSIQRAVYKDLVLLLQKDCLLSPRQLRAKGELSFERDALLEGSRWSGARPRLPAAPGAPRPRYREVRQFRAGHHLVRFYFLTRAYSSYAGRVLDRLRRGLLAPDVLILNSCLGDLSRYGRHFRRRYPRALESLFGHLRQTLPESCLLVWNTAMPAAETIAGDLIPLAGAHQPSRLREDVMEANFYSSTLAGRYGLDVLDVHFHFRRATQHRHQDGIHWDELAHRYLSQLLLAHIADAWGVVLRSPHPVGRWMGGAPSGRHSDTRDRRQSRGRRVDQRPLPLPWHPPAARHRRSPWRAEPPHRPEAPTQTCYHPHHLDPRLPSSLPRHARHQRPPAICQPYHRDDLSIRQSHHRDDPSTRHPHHRYATSTHHLYHSDATSMLHPHHRYAPSTYQPHHRDTPSTRHPDHRDAPSTRQQHHRDAPSTRQQHHRDAPSTRHPDHRDAPSTRQQHHRDAPSTRHPDYRDAPSTSQLDHRDAPSTRHPDHRDAPSTRQQHHRDAPSTRLPDHRDAPSTSQPDHRDALSTRHPDHRDAPSTSQPDHRDAPSTCQSGHRDAPSTSQPGDRDAPSTSQLGHRDGPSTSQPGHRDAPSTSQPGHRDAPSTSQPGHRDAPSTSHSQPGHRDVPSTIQPDHRDAPSMRQAHHREAPSTSQSHQRDVPVTRQPDQWDTPSICQMEYSREASTVFFCESRLGPIRRISSESHGRRRAPPYPPRQPESYRWHPKWSGRRP